ncbi:MAG: glycosyltransferase family 4 protein [Deltaproteobacteria bacterium]|nr:glycosyltransferase family 4 protein [Deltaproteobacteria bacterium]
MKVLIGAVQAPFIRGGAEALVEGLERRFRERGHRTDVLRIPLRMLPRPEIVKNCLLWRLLDVEESYGESIDLFVTTKFPSYVVRHPRKVVWLFHQMREVYELYGTRLLRVGGQGMDQVVRDAIHHLDQVGLGEARKIFTISKTVAARLKATTGHTGECLYHPPPLAGRTQRGEFGDYVFTVSRLDRTKRVELLVEAMAHVRAPVRAIIAGEGPEKAALEQRVAELDLGHKVIFAGRPSDERIVELYAGALAVFFAPFDEDYGYVTLEAFLSGKPVITAPDSGGVMEFVEDGISGKVVPADPLRFADAIDTLAADRRKAAALGAEGLARVAPISWEGVLDALTSV